MAVTCMSHFALDGCSSCSSLV